MPSYLVTGTAGFIGFHLTKMLLSRGIDVVGIDVVNDYYSVTLKRDRLRVLEEAASEPGSGRYQFIEADLADQSAVDAAFANHRFDRVVHLAAQAGVRYSVTHPRAYIQSNIVAFMNILEACRHAHTPHLTYASSSSVPAIAATLTPMPSSAFSVGAPSISRWMARQPMARADPAISTVCPSATSASALPCPKRWS